ncbi:hypothetical protein, partial [Escherichia coli]|uniref:hypothetical protein n=1 Tax=Escherichia coli TaxID=562 RepID=UPI001E54967E
WLMMSLWDALRMNMMISYQELVRTFPKISSTPDKLRDFVYNCGLFRQSAVFWRFCPADF